MVHPDLKDAVWQVIEDYCTRSTDGGVHSDLIMRKFPQINEQELINAIGELIVEGKVTGKASSVDPYGNATAFHLRLRDPKDRPGQTASKPPRGGVGEFDIGFGDTKTASSSRETAEPKKPERVGMDIRDNKVDVGFGVDAEKPDRLEVKLGSDAPVGKDAMQAEAEANFEDAVTSFFGELQMVEASDDEAKSKLTEQLMLLMAMFNSKDVDSFTTPINKLAALKGRVKHIAPELVGDYILLIQTAVRAWLAKI